MAGKLNDDPYWLTTTDVAALLHVGKSTVLDWIQKEWLYAGWDLHQYWISREDFNDFKRNIFPSTPAGMRYARERNQRNQRK